MNIVIIAHNIRSTHNIGAILRTADGFGMSRVYCTGYTPYPMLPDDKRLPHISNKLTAQIHKTALGAEATMPITQQDDIEPLLITLKNDGFTIVALEQSPQAILLPHYKPKTKKIALLLGEEVHGTPLPLLQICNDIIEIPMTGKKESFNVSVAAGIAMYQIRHA